MVNVEFVTPLFLALLRGTLISKSYHHQLTKMSNFSINIFFKWMTKLI
jgi:hypothetical protein